MAQTPLGTATPYCTVAKLFRYHSFEQVADLMREGDGPRPSRMTLLDSTTTEGADLLAVMLAASGELESAVIVGNRYAPEDLAALTNSGEGRLEKIVADLAFWTLMQRRQPASADPKNCPGALQAVEELTRLRNGERIFGLQESADAGLPSTQEPDRSVQQNPLVNNAGPLFGTHADRTGRQTYRPRT